MEVEKPGACSGGRNLRIELQRVDQVIAELGLFLFDIEGCPFPRESATQTDHGPTDEKKQHCRGQDAVGQGSVGNKSLDLLDARPEGEQQQGADGRETDSFDPLEKLEAADKSLQERGEFLVFFLPHGLRWRSSYR